MVSHELGIARVYGFDCIELGQKDGLMPANKVIGTDAMHCVVLAMVI
jgi:hypothetical protein